MRKNKDNIYQVDLKPRWNFIAKFYFVCIILFVLFVAYIVIYRYIHWDEVQKNIEESRNKYNQVVVENTTLENN